MSKLRVRNTSRDSVLADRADKLDIGAGLDLDLHPAIPFGQMGLDGLE